MQSNSKSKKYCYTCEHRTCPSSRTYRSHKYNKAVQKENWLISKE